MAASLNVLLLLSALLLAAPVGAERLPDPTRPTQQFDTTLFAASAAASGVAAAAAGPVLQSVIRSPEKMAAIISDQEVRLGARYGDAVLVEIEESCVVLRGPAGRQVLRLYPSVRSSKQDGGCTPKSAVKTGDGVMPVAAQRTAPRAVVRKNPSTRKPRVARKVAASQRSCADGK